MPRLRLYQIDAFSDHVFAGNPAAVCPLESWLPDTTMLAIAVENNLSETAFFVPQGDHFGLRWFTPRREVSLCGHATLASAFVIFSELDKGRHSVVFDTLSGELTVEQRGALLAMDFPARGLVPCDNPPALLLDGLGQVPEAVLAVTPGKSYVAVYGDEATVRAIRPDFRLLEQLPGGVAVTAPGREADSASRYFAPTNGVPEDPVTGSIHCALVPYWAARLGKTQIRARQVSQRGGELYCEDRGDRVTIAGYAARYLEGTIVV
jgi:PhzF family phenazine biosynthesis protein